MDKTTCAFTGHRPKSFPWKYNEADRDCIMLKEILAAQIEALAGRGVTDWLTGMALGVDLWSAKIVLTLRRKHPALKLHCILPCAGQESKWEAVAQEEYHAILTQADEVTYVNQSYHRDCMMKRNRYLVDHASVLLAVYNGMQRSGTGATVRYAQRQGREIIIIDPLSKGITHINENSSNHF